MTITHKRVIDEAENPKEAIIPWSQFVELQGVLGLDFTEDERAELLSAKADLEDGNWDTFIGSDEIRGEAGK